jgi:hypothetical protein
MTDIAARMRQLVGTPGEWASHDVILGVGELALEVQTDGTVRFKLGDGVRPYSVLGYSPSELRNSLRVPFGELMNDLPPVATRAGKVLSFATGTGQPLATAPVSGSATDLATALASPSGYTQIAGTLAPVAGAKASRRLDERWIELYFSGDFTGMDPTGVQDSTVAMQAAFTGARAQGGKMKTLRIQAGTYKLTNSIITGSNLHVICEPGVVFDFSGLPNETTTGFSLAAQSNVYFEMNGAIVKGARATAGATIEGSSCGFTMYGAKHVLIRQAICKDWTTDGIFVAGDTAASGQAEDIRLEQCWCTNNRRNALSITHARNVVVVGGLYENSNGAPNGPFAGIDVEPDAGQTASGIQLFGVRTNNNPGGGLLFVPSASGSVQGNYYGVTVHGGSSLNDGTVAGTGAVVFSGGGALVNQVFGQVLVHGFFVNSPKSRGVSFRNWDADKSPRAICEDVVVMNPDSTGAAVGNLNRTAFAIYCDSTQGITTMGNIVLKDCRAEDTRASPRMVAGFWLDVDPGKLLKSIRIIDPVAFNISAGTKSDVNCGFVTSGGAHVDVDVIYTAPRSWSQAGGATISSIVGKRVLMTSNGTTTLPSAATCKGAHYEVQSAAGVTTTLSAAAGETIAGIGLTTGLTQSVPANAALLVRSNGGTSWTAQPVA